MAKSGILNLKLAALEESDSFTIVFNILRLAGDKSNCYTVFGFDQWRL